MSTTLVTGEAVPVDLRVARTGSRMLAAILDLAIEAAVVAVVTVVVVNAFAGNDADLAIALSLSGYVLAFLVLPVASETLWHGRTPGKAALGLRVLRDDGGPVRFRHAFARGLMGMVVERPGVTLGTAAVLSSMVSRRAKRLGDLIAGTVVVQERIPAGRALAVRMPPPLAGWASTLDLSALPGPQLLAARQLLARWPDLRPEARQRIGDTLATQVAAVVSPPPPVGTPAYAFLMAVLAERQRRDASLPPTAGWAGPPPTSSQGMGSPDGPFAPPG